MPPDYFFSTASTSAALFGAHAHDGATIEKSSVTSMLKS